MGVAATTCILLNRVSFFDVTRRPRLFAWHGFYSTRIGSPGWSHLHIICMMRVTTARFSEDSAQFSDEDSNYGNCASRARFHSLIRLYLQPLYLGAERGKDSLEEGEKRFGYATLRESLQTLLTEMDYNVSSTNADFDRDGTQKAPQWYLQLGQLLIVVRGYYWTVNEVARDQTYLFGR